MPERSNGLGVCEGEWWGGRNGRSEGINNKGRESQSVIENCKNSVSGDGSATSGSGAALKNCRLPRSGVMCARFCFSRKPFFLTVGICIRYVFRVVPGLGVGPGACWRRAAQDRYSQTLSAFTTTTSLGRKDQSGSYEFRFMIKESCQTIFRHTHTQNKKNLEIPTTSMKVLLYVDV